MRLGYKGQFTVANGGKYRLATIDYDYENEKEAVLFERTVRLMEIKGWTIDVSIAGCGDCIVEDHDEYKAFASDWREAKKCIRDCMKHGF